MSNRTETVTDNATTASSVNRAQQPKYGNNGRLYLNPSYTGSSNQSTTIVNTTSGTATTTTTTSAISVANVAAIANAAIQTVHNIKSAINGGSDVSLSSGNRMQMNAKTTTMSTSIKTITPTTPNTMQRTTTNNLMTSSLMTPTTTPTSTAITAPIGVTTRGGGLLVRARTNTRRDSVTRYLPWIAYFCSLDGNQFLCEVDKEFIYDRFNLTGLDEYNLQYLKESIEVIVDRLTPEMLDQISGGGDERDDDDCGETTMTTTTSTSSTIGGGDGEDIFDGSSDQSNHTQPRKKIQILCSAEMLYGLIHARFILTDAGLEKMRYKYERADFGHCARVYCEKQPMLPIGLHDMPNQLPVRLYCPRCEDVYVPHLSVSTKFTLDGAFFGTNFPQMFFMVYPECRPSPPIARFVPTLYGFRIHQTAYEYQAAIAERRTRQCPMSLPGQKCSGGDGSAVCLNGKHQQQQQKQKQQQLEKMQL